MATYNVGNFPRVDNKAEFKDRVAKAAARFAMMQSERTGLDTIYNRSPASASNLKGLHKAVSSATTRTFQRHRAKSTRGGRRSP